MERHFDEELRHLKEQLINMSSIAEAMIEQSIVALKDRDAHSISQLFEKEKEINQKQILIDDMALTLIALRQPAAGDLRFIISALKINADLERIGDLAINIVQQVEEILKEAPLKPLIDIPHMASISQTMVKDAINSFIHGDSKLAMEVCRRDDLVDKLNDQIFRELLTYMLENTKTIHRAIELILIARHLERIADHATNIAEDVYYIVEGKDIRHHAQQQES